MAVLAEPVLDTAWHGGVSARQARGLLLPLLAAFAWASGTVMAKRWAARRWWC